MIGDDAESAWDRKLAAVPEKSAVQEDLVGPLARIMQVDVGVDDMGSTDLLGVRIGAHGSYLSRH